MGRSRDHKNYDLPGAAGMGLLGAFLNGALNVVDTALHAGHDLFVQNAAQRAAEQEEEQQRATDG